MAKAYQMETNPTASKKNKYMLLKKKKMLLDKPIIYVTFM